MKKLQESGTILFGAALLCWIAIYNGFPLVYSDTGTYLESGFTLETPLDRPIMYGLFVRAASLNGFSPWLIIFTQGLLLAWLIRETVRVLFPGKNANTFTLISIFGITFFTGVPIVASELIADIFTPICLLSLFLVLYGKHSRKQMTALYAVLLISCACHISNVLICFSLVSAAGVIYFWRLRKKKIVLTEGKQILWTLIIPVVAIMTMVSSIAKSRHVFMMGHLVETGILNAYLDDHCPADNISLCKYRDRLPPGAETFIWNSDGDSVLLLTGGWLGSKEEYSAIISETFSNRKYLKMHIAAAATGTIKQLTAIRVAEGLGRYDSTQIVSQRIEKYFPGTVDAYRHSRQSRDEFADLPVIGMINNAATILSLFVIAFWTLFRRRKSDTCVIFIALIVLLIAAYVINCGICAILATVANRFGARLSWMAVLLAVLLICEWIAGGKKEKEISK